MCAGLLAKEARFGVCTQHVGADDLLGLPVRDRHGAAVRLLLGDHALLKMFQRCIAGVPHDVFECTQALRASNAIDVEAFAHVVSMTSAGRLVKV